jgi:hypothetical protein
MKANWDSLNDVLHMCEYMFFTSCLPVPLHQLFRSDLL